MSQKNLNMDQWLGLIEKMSADGVLVDPVKALVSASGKTHAAVSLTLYKLQRQGKVMIRSGQKIGRGFRIDSVEIVKGSPQQREIVAKILPDPTVLIHQPVKQMSLAVLVDYDNTTIRFRNFGVSISFAKLRQHLCGIGRPIFCEAYLSPSASKANVVTNLRNNGFTAIACPYERKDVDSVDSMIKDTVRKYAEFSLVKTIVIVSDDGDFSHDPALINFVTDFGKTFLVLNPSQLIDELQGEDEEKFLSSSPGALQWQRIAKIVLNSEQPQAEDYPKVEFVDKCFGVLRNVATVHAKRGYKVIESAILDEVLPQYRGDFTLRDVKMLLSGLIDGGILEKVINPQGTMTYYVFQSNSPTTTVSSGLAMRLLTGGVAKKV